MYPCQGNQKSQNSPNLPSRHIEALGQWQLINARCTYSIEGRSLIVQVAQYIPDWERARATAQISAESKPSRYKEGGNDVFRVLSRASLKSKTDSF